MMEPSELLTRRLSKKIPKGFKCVEQWAEESGMSAAHALRLLKTGVERGQFESATFLKPLAVGYSRAATYYRLKVARNPKTASRGLN